MFNSNLFWISLFSPLKSNLIKEKQGLHFEFVLDLLGSFWQTGQNKALKIEIYGKPMLSGPLKTAPWPTG